MYMPPATVRLPPPPMCKSTPLPLGEASFLAVEHIDRPRYRYIDHRRRSARADLRPGKLHHGREELWDVLRHARRGPIVYGDPRRGGNRVCNVGGDGHVLLPAAAPKSKSILLGIEACVINISSRRTRRRGRTTGHCLASHLANSTTEEGALSHLLQRESGCRHGRRIGGPLCRLPHKIGPAQVHRQPHHPAHGDQAHSDHHQRLALAFFVPGCSMCLPQNALVYPRSVCSASMTTSRPAIFTAGSFPNFDDNQREVVYWRSLVNSSQYCFKALVDSKIKASPPALDGRVRPRVRNQSQFS